MPAWTGAEPEPLFNRRSFPTLHQVLVSHQIGGAAAVAIRLASAARRRQLRCVGWVPGPGPASAALTQAGIAWRTYDLAGLRESALSQLIGCGRMLPGLVRSERPVVHIHNPNVYRFLKPALIACRARTVVHFHIEPTPEQILYALRFPPDHVVACARYIASTIKSVLGPRGERLHVTAVPNFVDMDVFRPGSSGEARSRLGIAADRLVVLMLANLAPHKGQATALRAVARLKARGLPIQCWLAGEDRTPGRAYEQTLRALCSDLQLDDVVRFLGFRSDASDLLRAADVFLLPSTHEGLPLSVLEAQACGIPVVGSTIPGIAEVIEDGDTGFIVLADDAATYAERIEMLFHRPDVRARIAASAVAAIAREYTGSIFEDRMFTVYRSLASARSA